MFGGADGDQKLIEVRIELTNGEKLGGQVVVSQTGTLASALNGEQGFVKFQPREGEAKFIAKSAICSVEAIDIPKAEQLSRRSLEIGDRFDPFAVLGVDADATKSSARSAYTRLMMQYHPDKFSGVELPREVAGYLAAMSKRINIAYSMIDPETDVH